MRQIVKSIVEISDPTAKPKVGVRVRGNLDFIEVLNSYPEFQTGINKFEKKKRGRPTDNPSPLEIDYLVSLVDKLYNDQGKTYTRDDRRRLKDLLNRAADGADFFDPIKSKHWIDMFSALDYTLHLFSKNENVDFSIFYSNYISFYSKLNNKKLVPFYARWLKELAALYTIYMHSTYQEFEQTQAILQNALETGLKQSSDLSRSRYETGDVRSHIMTNIFAVYAQDKALILDKLCEYIRSNPKEFVYESGELNSRYRRYYYTIKEMLQLLSQNCDCSFIPSNYFHVFSDENVPYAMKDSQVSEFGNALINEMMFWCHPDDASMFFSEDEKKIDEKRRLCFFVSEKAKYDLKTHSTIVFDIGEYPFERKRTLEEVVDNVVKLLRFIIMIAIIKKNQSNNLNEYETPSRHDVIDSINIVMTRMGLLPLPLQMPISYNDKSYMDFCLRKYIENNFDD